MHRVMVRRYSVCIHDYEHAPSSSPAAYPSLSSPALDDLQSDLSSLLASVLSHPSLRPKNLVIVPGQKAWVLRLDAIVFSDAGNLVDCLVMACRAALWDTRVPRTKGVAYRVSGKQTGAVQPDGQRQHDDGMDVDVDTGAPAKSLLGTRDANSVADFELEDYWDDGEVLAARDAWPVCVTLNMVCFRLSAHCRDVDPLLIRPRSQLTSMHFLDASYQEETAVPLRMHVMYAFPGGKPVLHSLRMAGVGTSDTTQVKGLIKVGVPMTMHTTYSLPRIRSTQKSMPDGCGLDSRPS